MLNRIRQIISVAPYNIVCEWSSGEIRVIQMEEKLKEWASAPDSIYKKLLEQDVFNSVKLDKTTKTLFWEYILKMADLSGNITDAQLDIDPDVLYGLSKSLA